MFLIQDILQDKKKEKKSASPLGEDNDYMTCEWVIEYVKKCNWMIIVDETFVNDNFNLYGLSNFVEKYNSVIKFVRGQYFEYPPEMTSNQLYYEAEKLYCYIHSRFLLTYSGVRKIRKKYEQGIYGYCPRVSCKKQLLLPIGLSPVFGEQNAKTYCPCCQDLYETDTVIDGSLFGPYFPHYFIQAFRDEIVFPKAEVFHPTFAGILFEEECPLSKE